jgi:hypothetical protein
MKERDFIPLMMPKKEKRSCRYSLELAIYVRRKERTKRRLKTFLLVVRKLPDFCSEV